MAVTHIWPLLLWQSSVCAPSFFTPPSSADCFFPLAVPFRSLFPGLFFSWVNIMSPCCRWSPHHVIYEAKALKCFIFIGHIFSSPPPPPPPCLAIYQVACFMQFRCCFCPSPTCPHFVENISLFIRELIATVAGCWLLVSGCWLLGGRLSVRRGVASYHKSSNTFTSIQSFVPFPLTTPPSRPSRSFTHPVAALVLRQTH